MVERYKVGHVAKRYSQIEWLDYNETFALVAKFAIVNCLITVAVIKGWELHQFDVNNTFFNGDLDEEIFIKVPQGLCI